MDFQVEEKGAFVRRVAGTISGDALGQEERKAYNHLSRTAKLKGFRKGRVPRSVLKKMYGKQVRADAIRVVMGDAVRKLGQDIPDVIHMTQWTVTEPRTSDGGISFELNVELRPTVELAEYKGVEVTVSPIVIDEAAVDKAVDSIRDQHSHFEPVSDRTTVEDGDHVSIDYQAQGGGPLAEMQAEGQELHIGSGESIEGLESGIIGAELGETRDIQIQFPQETPGQPELSGLEVTLSVTVREIKTKVVPELDDAFVEANGLGESAEAFRASELKKLEDAAKQERERELTAAILEELRKTHPIELPPGYVAARAQERAQETARLFMQSGLPPEQINMLLGGSMARIETEVSEGLHNETIIVAISDSENIEVTEEERDKVIESRAAQLNMSITQMKRMAASEDVREMLDADVKRDKVLDLLRETATIVEKAPEEPAADSAPAAAEEGDAATESEDADAPAEAEDSE